MPTYLGLVGDTGTPMLTTPPPTWIDRLNPVARLAFAILLAVPVLITLDWVSASVMLVCEVTILAASSVTSWRQIGTSLRDMAMRLRPVTVVGLIASVSMALYGRPGGAVYAHWWIVIVSHQSLLMALAVFLRILALALAAMVLIGRVDPTLMADGLAQVAHLPARFVLGTLAGVRMLGLMAADWRALGLARRARGLGDRHFLRRVAGMAFALLVIAIRRGTDLATAMEVRGFSAENARHRTWARPSRLSAADAVGLLITLAVGIVSLGTALWAGTFWLIWTGASS